MRLLRVLALSALTLTLACGDSDPTDVDSDEVPSDLLGTWVATTLIVGATDLVVGGTTFEITFTAAQDYSFAVADSPNDLFCDSATSCSSGGVFAVQGQTLILDADEANEEDRTELSLTELTATDLALSGSIDGDPIQFVFVRP